MDKLLEQGHKASLRAWATISAVGLFIFARYSPTTIAVVLDNIVFIYLLFIVFLIFLERFNIVQHKPIFLFLYSTFSIFILGFLFLVFGFFYNVSSQQLWITTFFDHIFFVPTVIALLLGVDILVSLPLYFIFIGLCFSFFVNRNKRGNIHKIHIVDNN